MPISKEIHLKSRPKGLPTADNFEFVDVDIPDPGENEVLVQNIYMSVDPYMRGRMREDFSLGQVLAGGAVGKVVASNNPGFTVGDYVSNFSGWREYLTSAGSDLSKVDISLAPLSSYLGVMGMPGSHGLWWVTGHRRTERWRNSIRFRGFRSRGQCCWTDREGEGVYCYRQCWFR
jgi:NADPH-dependent curcumin reductase CurA